MNYSAKVKKEGLELIIAMQRAKIPAFESHALSMEIKDMIFMMIKRAKRHCKIQERYCSEEMNDQTLKRTESIEKGIEKRITQACQALGLTATFDGDPRGFTVKLHAPGDTVYNTWGGKETGYGIGENS